MSREGTDGWRQRWTTTRLTCRWRAHTSPPPMLPHPPACAAHTPPHPRPRGPFVVWVVGKCVCVCERVLCAYVRSGETFRNSVGLSPFWLPPPKPLNPTQPTTQPVTQNQPGCNLPHQLHHPPHIHHTTQQVGHMSQSHNPGGRRQQGAQFGEGGGAGEADRQRRSCGPRCSGGTIGAGGESRPRVGLPPAEGGTRLGCVCGLRLGGGAAL